jgi:hypothetical protein
MALGPGEVDVPPFEEEGGDAPRDAWSVARQLPGPPEA